MILNRQRAVRVARRPLEQFLRRLERELDVRPEDLTVCFVSDAEIARMNAAYRKRKGPTDVLSFPQENSFSPLALLAACPDPVGAARTACRVPRPGRGHSPLRGSKGKPRAKLGKRLSRESTPGYLGDIAIAPETARRYAKKNGRGLASELRVLILHGMLHLLGYDHETDRGQMDRIEQKLQRRLGLR